MINSTITQASTANYALWKRGEVFVASNDYCTITTTQKERREKRQEEKREIQALLIVVSLWLECWLECSKEWRANYRIGKKYYILECTVGLALEPLKLLEGSVGKAPIPKLYKSYWSDLPLFGSPAIALQWHQVQQ